MIEKLFQRKNKIKFRYQEKEARRKFLDGREAISILDSSYSENAMVLLVCYRVGVSKHSHCGGRALQSTAVPKWIFV